MSATGNPVYTPKSLHDDAWRHTYLAADTRWNVDVLHLLGHPVSPADWYFLVSLYDGGFTPADAVNLYTLQHASKAA